MRFLYSALLYLLLPGLLLRLLWRSRRAPDYRRRILERFGHFPAGCTRSPWGRHWRPLRWWRYCWRITRTVAW
jgi:3-deoxy-D-manno-octulosonic-acid transferase